MGQALRAAGLASGVAGVLLSAPIGAAGTLAQREVGLALERARQASTAGRPPDLPALRAALSALRNDDEVQRRRFDGAAARSLPAGAAARQQAAREAYTQGQGRVIELNARRIGTPRRG